MAITTSWSQGTVACVMCTALGLMACTPMMPNPELALVVARPQAMPVKTLTGFSEALGCMDDLLLTKGADYTITSDGLPDETGSVKAGTKEMMISAIAKMSVKSHGFTFVDYDQKETDINALHNLIGGPQASKGLFLVPKHYIRGAISQFDKNALRNSFNSGVSYQNNNNNSAGVTVTPSGSGSVTVGQNTDSNNYGLGGGYNQQASSTVISMDVNIVDMVTRQVIPGMSSNNSIVLTVRGKGYDFDATINKLGANLSKSLTHTEGTGAAVRTLVELSMIESLGKLAGVAYWQCLGLDSTAPDLLAKVRKAYDGSDMSELVNTVQAALARAGYYHGPTTEIVDVATKDAISHYQADNDLIANGRIDFDLYYNMVANQYIAGPEQDSGSPPVKMAVVVSPTTSSVLRISSNKGTKPTYALGEKLQVGVEVFQQAFVYCYYQDAANQVVRVFPNVFSPSAAVAAKQFINIPPTATAFELVMDKPGNERVDCMASHKKLDIGLPKDITRYDLKPIYGRNMDDVINEFRKRDLEIAHETLRLVVSS